MEGRNFDIRKQLLKFDDVMNDQRKAIFGQRLEIMQSQDLGEIAQDMRHQVIEDLVDSFLPPKSYADQWDATALQASIAEHIGLDLPIADWAREEGVDQDAMRERIVGQSDKSMDEKVAAFGPDAMRNIEKQVLLQAIDGKWREHLLRLEHLRSVVGFRGYAQRDPLAEYKNEGFTLFESMLNSLRQEVTQKLAQIRPLTKEEQDAMMAQFLAQQQRQAQVLQNAAAPAVAAPAVAEPVTEQVLSGAVSGFVETDAKTWGNPARNDSCPCGSGKKFKYCHGQLT